jgi:hypothetical protein
VIYNGADDNASGVAAMLLVAKAIASEKSRLPESRRAILFCSFDAEEQGLLGAKHYVKRPAWPLDKTALVINFDCVGRLRMSQFFASDVETNPTLAEFVREVAGERRLKAVTRFGWHGRSDHAVFIERGIAGVHFFTGAHADYHGVGDHTDKLNFEGGADVAWVAYRLLQQAIAEPGPIEFQKLDPTFDLTFALNLVQTLGIVPNVNAQEGRYPQIVFVVPGSPAARHGLKSGDEIVSLNGLVFNRVEDGLTIFPQLTFEEGLRLTILRGQETVEVKLPASVFEKLLGPKAVRLENGKYEVEFRYQASAGVNEVYLAGDFNAWSPTALRMTGPDKTGQFTTRLELAPGAYEYKYVVDGKNWIADPQNLYRVGKDDNSVLRVGGRRE